MDRTVTQLIQDDAKVPFRLTAWGANVDPRWLNARWPEDHPVWEAVQGNELLVGTIQSGILIGICATLEQMQDDGHLPSVYVQMNG